MKTKLDQIEAMAKVMCGAICKHFIGGCEDRVCDLKKHANRLLDAGYGNVSEYKAEIKRLKTKLFEQEQLTKQTQQNYNNAFVRLKTQQQEIERLKADYAKLQEQFAQYQMASDKEIRAQKKEAEKRFESNMKAVLEIEKKQAQIDVLNKAKDRLIQGRVANDNVVINANCEIDRLIKEVQEE